MAAQNHEPRTTATRRASLADDHDGEANLKHNGQDRRARRRACPITALFALLFHLMISSSGVAINVLVVYFKLQARSAGTFDLVARIMLFVASCMSIFYVVMHAFAARERYVRSQGSPQIFGYFTVAVAVLISRLSVPVWTGSVVLTAFVAARKKLDVAEGLGGNVVWVQLGLASLGLISIIVMVVMIETTDRPFATSWFSKKSFIKGSDSANGRVDSFDIGVTRAGHRPDGEDNSMVKPMRSIETGFGGTGFDSSPINTPKSPDIRPTNNLAQEIPSQRRPKQLVRVRSQPFPTPLEAVFTSDGVPFDAQDSPRKLAWRPPRGSGYRPQRQQVAAVSAETPLTSNPYQPEIGTSERSSSQYTDVQLNLTPQLSDNTPASSESDHTMSESPVSPNSPASGTAIDTMARAPLKIANPDQVLPQQEDETPTLAKLLGQLSTRAAARRRNSLLVRQADLTAGPTIDKSRAGSGTDMTAALFDQPADYAQPTQPDPAPRRSNILVRQADLDVRRSVDINRAGELSVFSLETSAEFTEIPPPPKVTQRTSFKALPALVRSHTAGSMLIPNFSRPGAPRPRTAGGENEPGSEEDDGLIVARPADARGRGRTREEQAQARRSRSLPPAREQGRSSTADVDSQPRRNISVIGRRKAPQPSTTPRFSAFPRAAVVAPAAGTMKVKGLGQGSARRLDQRIEKWRDGVLVEDEGLVDGPTK